MSLRGWLFADSGPDSGDRKPSFDVSLATSGLPVPDQVYSWLCAQRGFEKDLLVFSTSKTAVVAVFNATDGTLLAVAFNQGFPSYYTIANTMKFGPVLIALFANNTVVAYEAINGAGASPSAKMLWTVNTGPGQGTLQTSKVFASDNLVFITTDQGVYVLEASSGREAWSAPFPDPIKGNVA